MLHDFDWSTKMLTYAGPEIPGMLCRTVAACLGFPKLAGCGLGWQRPECACRALSADVRKPPGSYGLMWCSRITQKHVPGQPNSMLVLGPGLWGPGFGEALWHRVCVARGANHVSANEPQQALTHMLLLAQAQRGSVLSPPTPHSLLPAQAPPHAKRLGAVCVHFGSHATGIALPESGTGFRRSGIHGAPQPCRPQPQSATSVETPPQKQSGLTHTPVMPHWHSEPYSPGTTRMSCRPASPGPASGRGTASQ